MEGRLSIGIASLAAGAADGPVAACGNFAFGVMCGEALIALAVGERFALALALALALAVLWRCSLHAL